MASLALLAFQRGEDTDEAILGAALTAENYAHLRLIAQAITGLKDI